MGDEGSGVVRFLAGFSAGSRIAGYRLEEQIGRGGMAIVFRAQDERLHRQVALKVLAPALAEDEDFRHRFIRETRSAAAVDDPHIIPVFEAGDANGMLFIAMRYVPGGDVGTLVRRLGPLPIARAAGIISAVASALDAAHAAGLVHRDVKPANMLVDVRPGRPDHVYLSDFGLTKGAVSSASVTGAGVFVGTLDYCAPEQIQGQQVDARTDEYALACAVFTLLSGEPPFHRDDDMAVLYAHLSEPPPRLTSRRRDLPPAVDEVLLRALAKAPSDRYASCGEFADALRMALVLQRNDRDVAMALHRQTLADQQHRLGLDHADTLAMHASLSAGYREAVGSDEALALHQRTLIDQQHRLGPEHPDTLATRFNIAREMSARGRHDTAEAEFRAVLAVRQRTLGAEHPDTLATSFSVAQEVAARGDHAGAEEQFRRVLAVGTRTLGAEHPDTLIVRFSIARELAARGDHAGAEEEFRAVLPHLERRFGRDHPDALATRFGIAQEMAARDDHPGAEEQFRAVFAARQQALGPDHLDTLITWSSIAQEVAARGDHAGAEAEYRGMLPRLRRRLGPDHPDTLATRFSLAQEMAARGDHAGAEDEFRAVLPHLERRLGLDHPVTLTLWFSIAREMAARGDHAGAEGEFRDILPHLERRLGPNHPDTLAAAELISNIQRNRSHELRLIGAGAHIENDDTAVAKMPRTENRPAEPVPSSGDHLAKSGESPRPGGVSQAPRPEPARYLVGEMQSRVRAGAEVSLIVSITTKSPEPGLAATPLPGLVPGPKGVQVTLVVRPDTELLALGELQQVVTVPPHGDSQPVRFAFRARAVGLSRIRLTAWLGGTFLAELRLDVSVESERPMADNQRRSTPIGAMQADPGEVTLQVHTDGARYSFQLLSQRYLFGPVVAKSLTEEPGQAVGRTVAMLRKMAGDVSGYTPALAARWVRETGTGLWQDLVPKSIQDQYWQLRDSITSFTIACEDDTVPWELLYPLTPTDDAGFLVEQFPVLRRIYDQCRTHRVLVGEARYVVPPGSPANAQDEVDAVSRILGQPADSAITDLADLLDLLDAGSTGLLHFACHNTFSLEAGGSAIKMVGGALVPQLLNSAVGRRCLAARSPLIFVNACRSAGVSAEYTQMMGWASQFMAAGAGAFLGTLWPVRSSRASMFAEAFYAALVAGADLGRASLAARQATKDDADPTWLAYTVYGDPAALGVSDF
jgi:Protein kinase domain/CHAT domain/Tetratricopeptide repeat